MTQTTDFTRDTGKRVPRVQYWHHVCDGVGMMTMISGFKCGACGKDEKGKVHETLPKGERYE